MNQTTDPWAKHRTLARDRGLGSAVVDADRYTSADVYAAEREKIFRRVWLLVGRESEVSNPGDFIKREIYPLEVEALIVRGKDGVVRAFHNTCAHRGSALVEASEGTTNLFVCPYHAWSFGTDGGCKAIPGAEYFPQVDKDKIGLTPIHADIWNGFVFLNFDETPRQTLREYLGDFGELYGEIPFGDFRHLVEMTMDIDTNWKCLLDASLESYHVPFLHRKSLPMISSTANPLNVYYDAQLWPPHSSFILQSNPDWVPNGRVLQFVYAATGANMRRTLDDGAPPSAKLSSAEAVNPLGIPNFFLRVLTVFPLTQLYVFDDSYNVQQVWPMGVGKVRFVSRFYFRSPPASYLERFGEAHLTASGRDVLSEDVAMTSSQFRSLRSGGVKRFYFGENELLLRHTHEMIQAYLDDRAPG
jgi:phenylpropionate dioxygenase-like ring-hydroxylating dioxygenase large terminal subunit